MPSLFTTLQRSIAKRVYLDTHAPDSSVLLAGTGRGGTTWLSQLINHDHHYRLMFEPVIPDHVPTFAPLSRRPYLKRDTPDGAWGAALDRVFAGRLRNRWVDTYNTKLIANQRLVKDIRLNLALPWIAQRYPRMPIVWLLRHPCAVAYSKLKLGWDTHLDLFLENAVLMADHLSPFRSLLANATEAWDRHVLMWCVETLVPMRTLQAGETHCVSYEAVCDTPWETLDGVFAYLGRPYRHDAMRRALTTRSATHRVGSAVITGADPVSSWWQHVTPEQRSRAGELLRAFGLDSLYSADDPRPSCSAEDVIGVLRDAG
ncbi:MAG: sulfotransferase [Phycisphaerales bacterium JB063]